jgi:hypothetical protein
LGQWVQFTASRWQLTIARCHRSRSWFEFAEYVEPNPHAMYSNPEDFMKRLAVALAFLVSFVPAAADDAKGSRD